MSGVLGREVYLICGVSGAGKTWVCERVKDKFIYVPHDLHYDSICSALAEAAFDFSGPLITECPFAERIQKEKMEAVGFKVTPIFVIENPNLVASRYFARENRPIQKSAYVRASSILKRAQEWQAFYGTSEEVLQYLKGLA